MNDGQRIVNLLRERARMQAERDLCFAVIASLARTKPLGELTTEQVADKMNPASSPAVLPGHAPVT
jgi:hypothetical protein